jgi:hypothetical protein
MSPEDAPDLPSLRLPEPERREQVVQILSDRFAAGDLELEELERRLERTMKAQTLAELDGLVADFARAAPLPVAAAAASLPSDPRPGRPTVAILSGMQKRGRWLVGARHRVVAVLGGASLDFREAELAGDVTELRLTAVMGGIEVIVPPDLDVEVHGFGLLGGISDNTRRQGPPPAGARRLVVHALAVLGGVDVKVRQAGESGRDAARRLREERRDQRRQLRRGT